MRNLASETWSGGQKYERAARSGSKCSGSSCQLSTAKQTAVFEWNRFWPAHQPAAGFDPQIQRLFPADRVDMAIGVN